MVEDYDCEIWICYVWQSIEYAYCEPFHFVNKVVPRVPISHLFDEVKCVFLVGLDA